MSEALIKFNGHKHFLTKVVSKASIAIEVKPSELNLEPVAELMDRDQTLGPASFGYGGPIFFKREGLFVVLRGLDAVKQTLASKPDAPVRGMLITSPALKSARWEPPVMQQIETNPVYTSSPGKPLNPVFSRDSREPRSNPYPQQESTSGTLRVRSQYNRKRSV